MAMLGRFRLVRLLPLLLLLLAAHGDLMEVHQGLEEHMVADNDVVATLNPSVDGELDPSLASLLLCVTPPFAVFPKITQH